MKRIWILALFLLAPLAHAQPSFPYIVYTGTNPAGNTCSNTAPQATIYSGTLYTCQAGVLAPAPGGTPGGAAGGDLCSNSTYPDPTVCGLKGNVLPSLTNGYLNWTGSVWALSAVGGGTTTNALTAVCQTLKTVVSTTGTSTLYQCDNFVYWVNYTTGAITWVTETGPINFGPSPTAKYCVDSVNGLDTNAGTCNPLAPYKTLAKLQTNACANGDSVAFAANSWWHESYANTCTGITLSAYGAGNRPLIDSGDTMVNGNFSLVGGYTYTYQYSWTHANGGGEAWVNVFENGTQLQYVTSAALVDSTPGSYFNTNLASCDNAVCVLYIHPSGSTNPTSDGQLYEATNRNYAVSLGANSTVSGIWTRRNDWHDGSMTVGANSYIRDVLVSDGSKHNLFITESNKLANVVLDGAYYPVTSDNVSPLIYNFQPTGGFEEYDGVVVSLPSPAIPGNDTCVGIQGHYATNPTPLNSVTFNQTKSFNCQDPYETGLATNAYFNGVEAHGTIGAGNAIIAPDTGYTSNVYVNGLAAEGVGGGAIISAWLAGANIFVNGVTATSSGNSLFYSLANTGTFSLTNSTLNGSGSISMANIAGTITSFNAQNNTYGNSTGELYLLGYTPTTFVSDYNQYQHFPPAFEINGVNYANNYAGYKAALSADAHSGPNIAFSSAWGAASYLYSNFPGTGDTRGTIAINATGGSYGSGATVTLTFLHPYIVAPLVCSQYTGAVTSYTGGVCQYPSTGTSMTWTTSGTVGGGVSYINYEVYP